MRNSKNNKFASIAVAPISSHMSKLLAFDYHGWVAFYYASHHKAYHDDYDELKYEASHYFTENERGGLVWLETA